MVKSYNEEQRRFEISRHELNLPPKRYFTTRASHTYLLKSLCLTMKKIAYYTLNQPKVIIPWYKETSFNSELFNYHHLCSFCIAETACPRSFCGEMDLIDDSINMTNSTRMQPRTGFQGHGRPGEEDRQVSLILKSKQFLSLI